MPCPGWPDVRCGDAPARHWIHQAMQAAAITPTPQPLLDGLARLLDRGASSTASCTKLGRAVHAALAALGANPPDCDGALRALQVACPECFGAPPAPAPAAKAKRSPARRPATKSARRPAKKPAKWSPQTPPKRKLAPTKRAATKPTGRGPVAKKTAPRRGTKGAPKRARPAKSVRKTAKAKHVKRNPAKRRHTTRRPAKRRPKA